MRHPGGDDAAGEAFWRFSLALYARPGVAEALIAIQDRAGHDVNLILFGLWLGASEGRNLAAGELEAARAGITPIAGAAVAPLRRLRRRLKGSLDPDLAMLRRRVGALEIAAERRVQDRLAAQWSSASRPKPDPHRPAPAQAHLAPV